MNSIMIDKDSIRLYFDMEAEAQRKSWDQLMALSTDERIRKRKAIYPVYLDKNYKEEVEDEDRILLRVTAKRNLSDFKEGECVLLHEVSDTSGVKCVLRGFIDEEILELEVFPPNMPNDLSRFFDQPLALDKDVIDLRNYVFDPFVYSLPENEDNFWPTLLINTKDPPQFEDIDKNREELDDTIKNYKLSLLPKQEEAIVKSMSAKDYYLIQGPPGTGKSFVLGLIILEELLYFDHKVAVIGPNHMAINNALAQVLFTCPGIRNNIIKIGQAYNAPTAFISDDQGKHRITNINRINVDYANSLTYPFLYGLTPHSLYTSRARDLEFDTLIIDEAGQMTIPLALMGMNLAKKVILAGDHKQLPPIISSEDTEEALKQSIFQALITESNYTMLNVSFRMCEPICNFVSELFYDNKVEPMKKGCGDLLLSDEPLYSFDSPIVFCNINDDGEQNSDKEADYIVSTICGFVERGVPTKEIAVLAPFRAQVANIRRKIRKSDRLDEESVSSLSVDTVDKMQGQEREIIFYSFTAGNSDYLKEMADFLCNPNKLNVAFSRAKSKLIIVGNLDRLAELDSEAYPHLSHMLKIKDRYVELS